jgi:hypothetical protein
LGTVIIAVAGIAGTVAGAYLTGRAQARNLRQQLRFAARQDKLRIYSSVIGALEDSRIARSAAKASDYDEADVAELSRQLSGAWVRINELQLVGPPELGSRAREALTALNRRIGEKGSDPTDSLTALAFAMRNDLGEK